MPRKKKQPPLHKAYANKAEFEAQLRASEGKAWDRLVRKAQRAKSSSPTPLKLVSLPKEEQAKAIYELMDSGALPLATADEQRVLHAIALDPGPVPNVGLFGQPLPDSAASSVETPFVEVPRPSSVKGQLGLFDAPATEVASSVASSAKPSFWARASNAFRNVAKGGKVTSEVAPLTKEVAKGLPGLLGKGWGKLGGMGQAGLVIGAVDLLLDPAANFVSGLGDDMNVGGRVDHRLERMVSGEERTQQFERLRAKRQQKVAELTQRNTLLLAQNAPHLFNQLMAGRTLPRGATVIGGEPRTDLVQQVAAGMTQGRFPPPQEGELPLGGV